MRGMLSLIVGLSVIGAGIVGAFAQEAKPVTEKKEDGKKVPVAGLSSVYHHNSHSDVIISRTMQTYTLDDKGEWPSVVLKSLFIDQPDGLEKRADIGKEMAKKAQVRLSPTIADALTLGTGKLAVEGVLLIAEHGKYPRNAVGNIEYPKRRFFEETVKVYKESGKVAPIFIDKHLADNWKDAKWIYDTAKEMKIPLMAGSSLPVTWRKPAADVKRDAELKEILVLSYHTLDAYGFHAIEIAQALAERRKGGETGIASVQTLSGEAVWKYLETEKLDPELYNAAWDRLPRKLNGKRSLREAVKAPDLMIFEYKDGLKVYMLTMNGAVGEWSASWKYKDEKAPIESTWFYTQEARPFYHFSLLLQGIEKMMQTGKPTWPVERTLMSSGALDAALISKSKAGEKIATPELLIEYKSDWDWVEPVPAPADRPVNAQ
jgi:hypothetical protein